MKLFLFFAPMLRAACMAHAIALLAIAPAWAQDPPAERVALVIGNASYVSSPLSNPTNDAKGMTELLRDAGFQVDSVLDANQQKMRTAVEQFGKRIKDERVKLAIFYYAGHGVQLDWRNYLIPVDARVRTPEDVRKQSVEVSDLLRYMQETKNRSFLVVLDACRDNPFAGTYQPMAKGLSQFDAPVGSMIAFSTSPGNVALDGDGSNGLYTSHLLREFSVRNARIEDAFKRVRLNVRVESGGKQIPWESTSLEDDLYLFPLEKKSLSEADQEAQFDREVKAWMLVKSATKIEPLIQFLREFPSGNTSELAQARLNRLLLAQGQARAQQEAKAEAERLEQQRLAELKAQEIKAQQAKAEAERLRMEQEKLAQAQAREREAQAKREAELQRQAQAETERLEQQRQAELKVQLARAREREAQLQKEAQQQRLAQAEAVRLEQQRQTELKAQEARIQQAKDEAERLRMEQQRQAQAEAARLEQQRLAEARAMEERRRAEQQAQELAQARVREEQARKETQLQQEAQRQRELQWAQEREEARKQDEARRAQAEAARVAAEQAQARAAQEAEKSARLAAEARAAALALQAAEKLAATAAATKPAEPVVAAVLSVAATPYYQGMDMHMRNYTVGDEYGMRVVDLFNKSEKPLVFKVTRVDLVGDRVEYNDGEYSSDLMGNIAKNVRGTMDAPRQFYPSELYLGKKWHTHFRQSRPNGTVYTFDYTVKVVAKEKITVPAGTYEAYRLEALGFNLELGASIQRKIWVTPGINADIAHETHVRLRNNRIDQWDRQELVSYKAAAAVMAHN